MLERADEAARTARSMAGEARIAAAQAARPDLERAERLSYNSGASYIGQVADGKRQGLGVADLTDGERQAGVWQADQLNGLGTVRLADDTRYAGQWRDGQSTGLGVREKPGVERAEGNFVMGRLEGLGVRRHARRAQPDRSPGSSMAMPWKVQASKSWATASATRAVFAAASATATAR